MPENETYRGVDDLGTTQFFIYATRPLELAQGETLLSAGAKEALCAEHYGNIQIHFSSKEMVLSLDRYGWEVKA